MIDDDDDYDDNCGALGGVKTGMENRNTRRKSAPMPLCQLQIPHELTRP
jgi:hypothetical protein